MDSEIFLYDMIRLKNVVVMEARFGRTASLFAYRVFNTNPVQDFRCELTQIIAETQGLDTIANEHIEYLRLDYDTLYNILTKKYEAKDIILIREQHPARVYNRIQDESNSSS